MNTEPGMAGKLLAENYSTIKGGSVLELRVLRYFLTVVNEGNITKAAEILHVTQPTLSRQLKELEQEIGTLLLIRGKRAVRLTDAGFLFKQQAETVIELADRLEHTFSDEKDLLCGTIRVGATEAMGSRRLAAYMRKFQEKYPFVRFDLYNGMADNVKEMIENGVLDLGFVLEPIDISKFEYVRLPQKEVWGVLMRKDHVLAEKKIITVDDIRQYDLIMPKREKALSHVLNWMKCQERELKIRAYYNLLSNTAFLVEEGMGIAVCLEGALSVNVSPDICFRRVSPEHTTTGVILWKRNHLLFQAASLFIRMMQEQIN